MGPNIGGVYGDGVYGESVTGEILQENMDKSYRQTVTELKWAIDQNMSFLADYVERLRGADQATYFAFRKEFLETAAQYKHDLGAANSAGENATSTEKKAYINNLNIMKNYTTESVKNVQKIANRNPGTADAMAAANTSVLDNDANPLNRKLPTTMDSGILRMPAPARPGALGDYRTTSGNMGETVQMVNVGPLRAWWNGLGDNTKTMIKISAVAAAIFGGDLLYKKFFKKEGSKDKKEKTVVEADSLLGDLDVDDTNELESGEFGTEQHEEDDLDDDIDDGEEV